MYGFPAKIEGCRMTTPAKTEIEIALYNWLRDRAFEVIAPNVYILQGEQDMLAISRSGYASEFEIKMTRSDYLIDFSKTVGSKLEAQLRGQFWLKHEYLDGSRQSVNQWDVPKYFWFVVPAGMVDIEDVPSYAGLLYAFRDDSDDVCIRIIRKAPARKGAAKVPSEVYGRITVSLTHKFWALWTKRETKGER